MLFCIAAATLRSTARAADASRSRMPPLARGSAAPLAGRRATLGDAGSIIAALADVALVVRQTISGRSAPRTSAAAGALGTG
eukprot:6002600-Prymnesium_polylepis.1